MQTAQDSGPRSTVMAESPTSPPAAALTFAELGAAVRRIVAPLQLSTVRSPNGRPYRSRRVAYGINWRPPSSPRPWPAVRPTPSARGGRQPRPRQRTYRAVSTSCRPRPASRRVGADGGTSEPCPAQREDKPARQVVRSISHPGGG